MSDRDAFLAEVLDTPYCPLTRHCWWLQQLTQLVLFGRELPEADPTLVHDLRRRIHAFARHPERRNWREVPAPEDGAFVMMRLNAVHDIHVGTYLAIAEGRILHTDEPHGAVLSPLLELTALRGWRLSYLVPID